MFTKLIFLGDVSKLNISYAAYNIAYAVCDILYVLLKLQKSYTLPGQLPIDCMLSPCVYSFGNDGTDRETPTIDELM